MDEFREQDKEHDKLEEKPGVIMAVAMFRYKPTQPDSLIAGVDTKLYRGCDKTRRHSSLRNEPRNEFQNPGPRVR